ncbi:uncharacterized protein LOC127281549 [Leptopilina boulardi]|uniref:uncharacterized protein LOC127281549 n=1 Tax=Leptopilina boulardi TaxID=63433 RepID=UPI0021F5F5F4|nr:uncharacterized protein LOC127281549 [Leptopilina boulardi]XP_051161248.1 uncharacterized protein LOC127281549 [Leptopilina boulardi]
MSTGEEDYYCRVENAPVSSTTHVNNTEAVAATAGSDNAKKVEKKESEILDSTKEQETTNTEEEVNYCRIEDAPVSSKTHVNNTEAVTATAGSDNVKKVEKEESEILDSTKEQETTNTEEEVYYCRIEDAPGYIKKDK